MFYGFSPTSEYVSSWVSVEHDVWWAKRVRSILAKLPWGDKVGMKILGCKLPWGDKVGMEKFPFLGLVKMVKCKSTLPLGDKVRMKILGLVK